MRLKKWRNDEEDSLEKKLSMYGTPRNSREWRKYWHWRASLKSFRLCPDHPRPRKNYGRYSLLTVAIWMGACWYILPESPHSLRDLMLASVLLIPIVLLTELLLPPPRKLWSMFASLWRKN